MKANELRIGNYVLAEVGLPSLQIHYITASDILAYYNNAVKCLPIPLTEEWLLKFGFEKNGSYKSMRFLIKESKLLPDTTFIIIDYEGKGWIELVEGRNSSNVSQSHEFNCQYVHQLQNLYFCLTGQELEVK